MLKNTQVQRLMFMLALAGLFAVTANFACFDDVCADMQTGALHSMEEINANRILTLKEALGRSGALLSAEQQSRLERTGQLLGAVKLDRPVKHPNGTIEMPSGWLPEIPKGHPWRAQLTPADDAFYSFVEERIFKARLFDPANPDHMKAATAYLEKQRSASPEFIGWTYSSRTECAKKKYDAAPPPPDSAAKKD